MAITRRLATFGMALLLAVFAARTAHAQTVGVSGLVYAQYDYQLADTANHANAFDVKRAYLTFTRGFTDKVSARVTADIYRDANGSLNYRLKYAYVAWSPSGGPISLRFGQIHTPLLDWEEGLWGYRVQGTMPLERYGYVTSSDLGIGAIGSWNDQAVNA
ncbi:MAG: porin, partial [Gemmatimonadota bacterium]